MSDDALRYAATMRGFRVSAFALVNRTRREGGLGSMGSGGGAGGDRGDAETARPDGGKPSGSPGT